MPGDSRPTKKRKRDTNPPKKVSIAIKSSLLLLILSLGCGETAEEWEKSIEGYPKDN